MFTISKQNSVELTMGNFLDKFHWKWKKNVMQPQYRFHFHCSGLWSLAPNYFHVHGKLMISSWKFYILWWLFAVCIFLSVSNKNLFKNRFLHVKFMNNNGFCHQLNLIQFHIFGSYNIVEKHKIFKIFSWKFITWWTMNATSVVWISNYKTISSSWCRQLDVNRIAE